ncbi:MAG TPA: DUF362 domain-containing protein [Deltaproteobacteria bacterium]|nr:DUF362 domain-containing protein [Deltaproteobacteria bacterium]
MTPVIVRESAYDYNTLKPTIWNIIETLEHNPFKKNSRILIKPNLLLPAKPEKAITTHPLVVRAVAEYALNAGCTVTVADSQATGTFHRLLKEGEYHKTLEDLDVQWVQFNKSVKKNIGEPFGEIDLAKDALEADAVINLAKLKTHSQMILTLGVKNLFGCVVGLRKPEWHMRAGVNRHMFTTLLVQIYRAIDPSLTIIDGILAMEGQGPGKGGSPRRLDVLVASNNAAAADAVVCNILGLNPMRLPTHTVSKELGVVEDDIKVDGVIPKVSEYRLPVLAPLTFGPGFLQGFMRKHLVQRPTVDPDLCKQCGECRQYCPADAISDDGNPLDFDYGKCIRCYCCIEVCPHGALRSQETRTGRLIRSIPGLRI